MRSAFYTLIWLYLASLTMSGCSRIYFEGDSSSTHNKKTISVSVPTDPIPPPVKPLPVATPNQDSEKSQPRLIPRQVDQKLLPQDVPPENPLGTIPLSPSRPPGANSLDTDNTNDRTAAPDNSQVVYDGVIITEDMTWSGSVLVKGFFVVAPQATLRIEPGTVVRFSGADHKSGAARLVVQGRIQASGTADNPILMTSGRSKASRGDWGGISLISSEKRNILEHCRIEYADSGIDARFSSINLKMVSFSRSNIAIRAHEAVLLMIGGTVAESVTGIEAHDSELEVRDVTVTNGQRGVVVSRSSIGISSVRITGNKQFGLLSESCRIKMTSVEISGNGTGARFKGGEGQILMTRFIRNRETALHLSGARMKVQQCLFSDNNRDAIRLEDGRALVSGNIFSSNTGYNLYNAGREDVSALLNWWGNADRSVISHKIHDSVRDPRFGSVQIFPWLTEKPALLP